MLYVVVARLDLQKQILFLQFELLFEVFDFLEEVARLRQLLLQRARQLLIQIRRFFIFYPKALDVGGQLLNLNL